MPIFKYVALKLLQISIIWYILRIIEKNIEYFKNNRTDYWFCLINYAYNCAVSGNKEYAMRNYKRACLVKPWCFISNITYYFRIVKALHQEGGF